MEIEKFGTAGDIEELLAVRDRIDALTSAGASGDGVLPRVDLLDLGDAYQLLVEVPGVSLSSLEVALQGKDVVVAGIRENLPDDTGIVFSERPNGPFQRTVELPAEVDRENATAHLESGVLIVNLPKA
ncbi:MAG: Hsp20/alpha crystallin family protein [Deinococcales bacterium]|jgi:HSP20 family protein